MRQARLFRCVCVAMLTSLAVGVFAALVTRELQIVNVQNASYLRHPFRSEVEVGMSGKFP